MKFLLLITIAATICYVSAGKRQRLIVAMNGGMLPGVNGGLVNGINPGMMAGGLNPLVVAGGGAGFIGQPQFAQFVPGVPAPIPNLYPVPAVNTLSFIGVPQMAPVNPPQQPLMGFAGGAVPQQLPLQVDPLRRFRRDNMKPENTLKATVDTQIPAPSVSTTAAPCGNDYEDN